MATLVSAARVIVRLNLMSFILLLSTLSQAVLAQEASRSSEQGSLHELTSSWTDQNGQRFVWKDMQDRIVLASMVFTSCEQTCPLIISELAALQKALPEKQRSQVQVLLFSFDPERDTQERLAQYAKERKLNPDWRLLRAPDEDVQELAAVLGVRYKKMQTGNFAHSNIFTVIGPKGQIGHQQLELFRGRAETVEALQALLNSAPRK
ncbi:SCO family protein [Oligoflexus tunisiensis]|uniref:SCO family protein n=1 Tax=Oligoflexus tunisiensis TaxID=708132 RepID=UPI00114D280E|nr:SCO family protein [Oligoflexus tunisiensis]